jgi:hypothetical protein
LRGAPNTAALFFFFSSSFLPASPRFFFFSLSLGVAGLPFLSLRPFLVYPSLHRHASTTPSKSVWPFRELAHEFPLVTTHAFVLHRWSHV